MTVPTGIWVMLGGRRWRVWRLGAATLLFSLAKLVLLALIIRVFVPPYNWVPDLSAVAVRVASLWDDFVQRDRNKVPT